MNHPNSDEVTINLPGYPVPQDDDAPSKHPERIGRYRIVRVLGKGGFGVVYLAIDEQLDRPVAVKVPHANLISSPDDAEAYLAEARMVANLDHPNIVPVHDAGSTDECPCYVVSKCIDGTDLSSMLKKRQLKSTSAVELVATVADALHYAHTQGLVHRDIKPSNILIGKDGKPYVVDFGLALREENVGKGPKYVGTPAYMSPEQARGEGHRVDGRSDIFSLGVVLYQLLAGRRPFRGSTQAELKEQVTSYEPRPLRQYDEKLPKELDRICHKALSKRASERYSSAHDMAEDLRYFLAEQTVTQSDTLPRVSELAPSQTPAPASGSASSVAPAVSDDSVGNGRSSVSQLIKIVPKGLRSFDAEDAEFFLELLPGPRDRRGLPDSLRFWKTRIEEADPDNTFSVGLIYGPSGCGKSSLVKAGLMPRISDDVVAVYVEATPNETETRLLIGLRKHFPLLEDNLDLTETLAALRRGQGLPVGKKVLIILDQFEQWLHAKKEQENTELSQALRQCDGGRLQCLLMVRDDFWLAVSRFLRELEVRLLEGHNIALADLFDIDHAKKVLAAFGRAFGKLPESASDATQEQQAFLEQSVSGLADEGKVICVRLALFAEMMKGKTWSLATLKEVGGTKGVGTTFLEETFSSSTASPAHRFHQKAARRVLKALLPDSGTNIKGQMKSYDELLERSGYARRPNEFDDLMEILDSEIRLITPTDPEGAEIEDEPVPHAEIGKKYYQLTHDYLVPSLREWLTRKQKETRRGRAELQLADRSALWNSKPENRHLPSWTENIKIRSFTNAKNWTQPQRKMMHIAGRVHGLRTALVAIILAATSFAGISVRNGVLEQRAEAKNETRSEVLVDSLLNAEITQVPAVISEMTNVRSWTDPLLKTKIAEAADPSTEKLHLSLALLPVDPSQIEFLTEQIPTCSLNQFPVVRDALLPYKDAITNKLWQQRDVPGRFQASAALARYAPDDSRWSEEAPFVAQHLTSAVSSLSFGKWLEHFRPASRHLTDPLIDIHADRTRSEKQREAAAVALAEFLWDEPNRLANIILVADEYAEFSPLFAALKPHAATVKQQLLGEMQALTPANLAKGDAQVSDDQVVRRDAFWKRQSIAAVTLVNLGHSEDVWSLLKFTPDPTLRSLIIHHLGKFRSDHNALAARLETESDVSIRRALIQSLGGLEPSLITPTVRDRIAAQLQWLYVNDLDPGVHGSASWSLRQWGAALPELPRDPVMTQEQRQRFAKMAAEVAEIKRLLSNYEQEEFPVRLAKWERELREQPQALPASLSEGLVVHYPLDETDGTETASSLDDQPRGAYQGPSQPKWMPGVVAGSLRLDGEGGHFSCEESFEMERNESVTLSGWFMLDSDSRRGALVGQFDYENQRGFAVNIDPVTSEVMCELAHDKVNRISVRGKITETTGHWHHLLVTYDGSSSATGVSIYVDGRIIPTTIVADELTGTIHTDAPLHIGIRDLKFPFKGQIDDVRIYQRRLGENEVGQLFESGLQAMTQVPAESRKPGQQSLLTATYRGRDEPLQRLQSQLAAAVLAMSDARWQDTRRWYVNGQNQTMVVIQNPSLLNPSFEGSSQINHTFAISSREVTLAEYRRFRENAEVDPAVVPSQDCPVHQVSWYSAAEYCNWLSRQEGIDEDQWVYEPNADGKYAEGMKIKENFLELSGYRLPTEAEWAFACRAASRTEYCFGRSVSLLGEYANYVLTSSGHTQPVESMLPNEFGLFDMHGNLWEWTQNNASGPMSPVLNYSKRVLLGGSFYSHAKLVRSSENNADPAGERAYANGFRPVRTFDVIDDSRIDE